MKIIVAPDSFKNCLPAGDVADVIAAAAAMVFPSAGIISMPMADGGEGTGAILARAMGAETGYADAVDALGRPMRACYAVAGNLAILESAAVCGIQLLKPSERDVLNSTTAGLGMLVADALERGCRRFIITLGGTATNDGGMGLVGVPGLVSKASDAEFTVACDVDAAYVGPHGASILFGPQKGASPHDVEILEERMRGYAAKIKSETGTDVSHMPGAGAAGGLGGAFAAYFNAELKHGVEIVLDALDFDRRISGADLVITGEGRTDVQTFMGKVPYGVLGRASRYGIPVLLASGSIDSPAAALTAGFAAAVSVTPDGIPLEDATDPDTARSNIHRAVANALKSDIGPGRQLFLSH